MGCAEWSSEIWEWPADRPLRQALRSHLDQCPGCAEQWQARAATAAALREEAGADSPDRQADARVLEHVRHVARHLPPRAPTPLPSQLIAWMVSAAAIVLVSVSLGFLAGQRVGIESPSAPAAVVAASFGSPLPRPHAVSLAADTLDTLRDGHTYLLAGPPGGPYRVLGAVRFDEVAAPSGPAPEELVVAVGPHDGWATGDRLAVADLSDPQVEILGRRALARH